MFICRAHISFFNYSLGALQYRSVCFENETIYKPNYQGNAAVNIQIEKRL